MQWVRMLTKTLSWTGDRMALATFADIAVPQVRLTRDPNTVLCSFSITWTMRPTFRLENDTSWNTNVEDAIYWGVKLVDTDQEMYGAEQERAHVRRHLGRAGVERQRAAGDQRSRQARHRG